MSLVIELVRLEEVIRKFLVRLDVARARAKERSLRGEHGSSVLGVIRGVRASRIERDRGGDEERERGASSGRRAAFRARGRGATPRVASAKTRMERRRVRIRSLSNREASAPSGRRRRRDGSLSVRTGVWCYNGEARSPLIR